MRVYEGSSMDEIYKKACTDLIFRPDGLLAPRGQPIREITNVALVLTDPYRRIVASNERALSMRYLAGELAFYLAASDDVEFIAHYSAFWRKISDDGETVNSAYGKRLFGPELPKSQFRYAIEQLIADKDTRKAVMTIYHSGDSRPSADNPCTMALQFFIRGDALDLTVYMRSNDIWLGTPYDVAFFTLVQERALSILRWTYPGLGMGTYTHIAGSFHVYEKNWTSVKAIAMSDDMSITNLPSELPRISETFEIDLPLFLMAEEDLRKRGPVPAALRTLTKEQLSRGDAVDVIAHRYSGELAFTDPLLVRLFEYLKEGV